MITLEGSPLVPPPVAALTYRHRRLRRLARRAFDALLVLLVGEVGSVTAATLDEFGGSLGEDPLAAVTEDAGPITFEERHVEHPSP